MKGPVPPKPQNGLLYFEGLLKVIALEGLEITSFCMTQAQNNFWISLLTCAIEDLGSCPCHAHDKGE